MTDAIRELFELLTKKEKSGSDYTGTVTRVDGKTAYVQFDGSDITDTPVALSIGAKEGDSVRIRVADGRAWLVGNDDAPPNDSSEVGYELALTNALIRQLTTEQINGENGWINLLLGTFNYGNKLIWNGRELTIVGVLAAGAGSKIGPWIVTDTSIYKTSPTWGNATAGAAYFGNDGISITDKFKISAAGALESTSGKIGGWTIGTNNISCVNSSGNAAVFSNGSDSYQNVLYVRNGAGTTADPYVFPFILRADGTLYATKATISGTLTAGANSKIGPWNISNNSIWYGATEAYGTAGRLYFGTQGISLGSAFKVNSSGDMTATSGTIGDWKINGSLQSNMANFSSYLNPDVLSISSTASGNSASLGPGSIQAVNSSSGAYSMVSVNGIETTGNILAVGSGYISTTNGNVRAKGSGNVHCYSENSTTGCYVSCLSQANGTHGIISNGYWNGSKFNASTSWFCYRGNTGYWYIANNTTVNGDFSVTGALMAKNYGGVTGRVVTSSGTAGGRVGGFRSDHVSRLGVNGQWTYADFTMKYITIGGNWSDIRLKENLEPVTESAVDFIDKIKLYSFDWKGMEKHRGHQNIGIIADELEKLDDGLVSGGGEDEDGNIIPKEINTLYLSAYEAKAIQELHSEVNSLKAEIAELKGIIAVLMEGKK